MVLSLLRLVVLEFSIELVGDIAEVAPFDAAVVLLQICVVGCIVEVVPLDAAVVQLQIGVCRKLGEAIELSGVTIDMVLLLLRLGLLGIDSVEKFVEIGLSF